MKTTIGRVVRAPVDHFFFLSFTRITLFGTRAIKHRHNRPHAGLYRSAAPVGPPPRFTLNHGPPRSTFISVLQPSYSPYFFGASIRVALSFCYCYPCDEMVNDRHRRRSLVDHDVRVIITRNEGNRNFAETFLLIDP